MLDIRDLELVEAIVTHGNFARAARVLAIGQSVLTRRVADLEHRLGAALFRRAHAGAEPTDICRAMVGGAADVLERVRALEQRMVEVRGGQEAELRIGAGGIAADTCVLSAAAAMIGTRPGVRLHIAAMNWMNVLHAVRERKVELGILELTELGSETSDLLIEPLLRHPGFFAARAGHPLAALVGLTLAEILAYPLVFLGKLPTRVIGPMARAREEARLAGTLHPTFPAVVHESPSAALQVALQSDAVVAVTAPIAAPTLRGGALCLLPWHEPWLATNFGIVQVRGRRLHAAAEQFVELLRVADRAAFAAGQEALERMSG